MNEDKIGLDKATENKEPEETEIHIPETLDKNTDNLLSDLERRIERGRKYQFVGYDWGFNWFKNGDYKICDLNFVLNGLNPELYILTGGTSVGKTTFCRNVMDEIIIWNNLVSRKEHKEGKTFPEESQNKPLYRETPLNEVGCIYFSYEQGVNELQIKTLSKQNEINGNKINRGVIEDKQLNKIIESTKNRPLKYLWKYQVIYPGEYLTTVKEIEKISLRVKKKLNVKHLIIFVDYLQIIKPSDPSISDTRGIVEYNISELRRLVRNHNFSVIAISSVARGKEDITGTGTGKESGGIEYTADVLMNLTTDWDVTKELNPNETTDTFKKSIVLSVVKNRNNGQLKNIPFVFNTSYQEFTQDSNRKSTDYNPSK